MSAQGKSQEADGFEDSGANPPIAAKAAKRVLAAFRTVMSFSGVTIADARELEAEHQNVPQEQEEKFYPSLDSDLDAEAMTLEEVLSRSRDLAMEEAIRKNKRMYHTSLSLGDVELCEGTSYGTSHKSTSEIEVDVASPSCSYGPSSSSQPSCSYDIV